MEIICINDTFPPEILDFYQKLGVKIPKKGTFYTVRSLIKNTDGSRGLLLQEIRNPKVPIKHPILGIIEIEPNFNIKRFSSLTMEPIEEQKLTEILKEIRENAGV